MTLTLNKSTIHPT